MPQSPRLTTQRADTWCDIHLHISPWQERVVFDEVQFFGDSLLSHEEYLHSHKCRAVNKLHCGEPQSHQTFSCRDQRRWRSFWSPSYKHSSQASITFNVLNKRYFSLAYLWLVCSACLCTCCRVQFTITKQPHTVLQTVPIKVTVTAHKVSTACQMSFSYSHAVCHQTFLDKMSKLCTLQGAVPDTRRILLASVKESGFLNVVNYCAMLPC